MKGRASALLPPLLYMGLIFFLSAQSSFPFVPSGFWSFDKLIHGCEYAVLGFLVARALSMLGAPFAFALAVAISALYGVSDEVHQAFVPRRSSEVLDAVADACGSLSGAGAWQLLARVFHKPPA